MLNTRSCRALLKGDHKLNYVEYKILESGHLFLFGTTANELLEILSEIKISKYFVPLQRF